MIAALAKQPAWVEGMSPETRQNVVTTLERALTYCKSPREIAAVTRALSSLEKNDIDRTRLFLEAEKQGDDLSAAEQARRIREALDEMDALQEGAPDA